MKKLFLTLALITASQTNVLAQGQNYSPDDHAPIGVMRDHIHKKGEIMASYRLSYMKMQGLRNGDDKVSTAQALSSYMSTPTKMTMRMHMLGAMYGITDSLTISAMGSFIEKSMDSYNRMNGDFSRETDDIGDTKLNTLYQFYSDGTNRMQLNLGISLPTGEINKKQPNSSQRLPYGMQIGSGSYEILPGLSFTSTRDGYSYGGQINATFRTGINDNGYKLGDSYNVTSWISKKLNNTISSSLRLDYTKNEAIEGLDSNIMSASMMATADASLQDKERLDLLFGVNFLVTKGYFAGNRIALEFGAPIYQRIDGPMLETDYKIVIGWQKTF